MESKYVAKKKIANKTLGVTKTEYLTTSSYVAIKQGIQFER